MGRIRRQATAPRANPATSPPLHHAITRLHFHASHFTHHISRSTLHAPRSTLHAPRSTFHVSQSVHLTKSPSAGRPSCRQPNGGSCIRPNRHTRATPQRASSVASSCSL